MKFPLWYHLFWITLTLAFGFLAVTIARRRQLRAWPALFAYASFRATSFTLQWPLCVAAFYHHFHIAKPYAAYRAVYWKCGIAGSLLELLLAFNVLFRIPSAKFIPKKIVFAIGALAAAAGCTAWALAASSADRHDPHQWMFSLNLASEYAWCAVFLVLIIGVIVNGFGFTLTGARIASGMLVKMVADLIAAQVYADTNLPRHFYLYTAGALLIVTTGCVAYWNFTMRDAIRASAELKERFLSSDIPTATSPAENEGAAA